MYKRQHETTASANAFGYNLIQQQFTCCMVDEKSGLTCRILIDDCSFRKHLKADTFNRSPRHAHQLPHVLALAVVFSRLSLLRDAAMLVRSWESRLCLSVRPSVCPSVTRVLCDKTKETTVDILIPYKRVSSLVF